MPLDSVTRRAVCVLVVSSAVAAAASSSNRGVDPGLASHYSGSRFSCLSNPEVVIDKAWVNDNFCDCPDGSDEPGTPACGNGVFHCRNIGHEPRNLSSSFVDDGVCDCCDGSDEAPGACQSTCMELGAAKRAEMKRQAEQYSRGALARDKLVRDAAAMMKQWQKEGEGLGAQIEAQRVRVEELEGEKNQLQAEWDVKKEQLQLEEERRLRSSEEQQEDTSSTGEAEEPPPPEDKDLAGVGLEAGSAADPPPAPVLQEADALEAEEAPPDAADGELSAEELGKKIAAQWTSDPDAAGAVDAPTEAGDDEAPGADTADVEDVPLTDYEDQDSKEPLEPPELLQARKAVQEAEAELKRLRTRKTDLETKLSRDYGPDQVFASMVEECWEVQQDKYTYEICPFNKAAQKEGQASTNLGKWEGFSDDFSQMAFTKGQHCWQGPNRSLQVRMVCGAEPALEAVEEPSRCEYEGRLVTPALCSHTEAAALMQHVQQMEDLVQSVHDELRR